MHPITTHVLDTALGKPAGNIDVILEKQNGSEWQEVTSGKTDNDGRIKTWPKDYELEKGLYRISFMTAKYFSDANRETFYPEVKIVFDIQAPGEHYHVPLLLSNFGYSTYRGS